ncbi:hypothetical protein HanIR_Chr12g0578571 [Helianthus annuus]|nr:hypothetical protein HanIR_Chr12g0578571 [Helianthus annuus]
MVRRAKRELEVTKRVPLAAGMNATCFNSDTSDKKKRSELYKLFLDDFSCSKYYVIKMNEI